MTSIGKETVLRWLTTNSSYFQTTGSYDVSQSEEPKCLSFEVLSIILSIIISVSELMGLSKCKYNGLCHWLLGKIGKNADEDERNPINIK